MSRFPESGLSVVLDLSKWTGNVSLYLRDIDRMEKAESTSGRSAETAGKAKDRFGRAVGQAGTEAGRASGQFSQAGRAAGQAGAEAERGAAGFSRMTERLLSVSSAINIAQSAVGFVQNLSGAMGEFTDRAATVQNVTGAFERISAPIGGAETALASLREQTRGAVSDLDLMRLTNRALINSSQEFTEVVGPQFGTIVSAAFAGAAATGQDLNYILEKIVTGIRRQSNMLLDDIGIWVTAEEANARYAATHGLVASEMNETQQAAAFAAEAIRQMDAIIAQSGGAATSLAIQTAQGAAQVQNALNQMAANATPSLQQFAGGFAQIGATVFGALAQLNPAPFFEGGANIIAAIAHGILSGLTLVVQAVTVVAQTIANFLRGFSPPKEGPLSDIDVGGENVVKAWLDRFARVSTAPVEALAGNVRAILGDAANLGTDDQITVLEQLQERIQNRLNAAVADLSRGKGSAEEVRALDQQREALAGQLAMLRERADLEKVFGEKASQTQAALDQYTGGGSMAAAASGGSEGGSGGGYTKPEDAAKGELKLAEAVKATGAAEKDRVADLREKLAVNKSLQDQYAAMGLDTKDLLREEGNLNRQIAEELTTRGMGLDETASELRRAAEIEGMLAPAGGGGGAVPALDLGMAGGLGGLGLPGGVSGPVEQGDTGFGSIAASMGEGPISQAFQRIQDDLVSFTQAFQEARDTLAEIDLFGAIREFFDTLSEIDTPQELLDFVGNLASGIAQFPGDLVQGFIDLFTQITGIELPGWLTEGLRVGGTVLALGAGFSLLAGVLPGVIAGVTGLVQAFGPAILLISLVGVFIDQINQRWGSFEGALNSAGVAIGLFRDTISIIWDEISNAVGAAIDTLVGEVLRFLNSIQEAGESIGIDLGIRVEGHLNEIETRREARELRAQAIGEIREVMAHQRASFSPELQMAVTEGQLTIPPEVVSRLNGLMYAALSTQDFTGAIHVQTLASSIGFTYDEATRTRFSALVNAQIQTGTDVLLLPLEVQAMIAAGDVTLDSADAQAVFQQVIEATVSDFGPLPLESAVEVVAANLRVDLAPEAVSNFAADLSRMLDLALAQNEEIEVSPGVFVNTFDPTFQPSAMALENLGLGGAATRSGGPGGQAGPASITGLMGGREAAAGIGGLGEVLAGRFGGGAGGEEDMLAQVMAQVQTLVDQIAVKAEEARALFIEGFLTPANEQIGILAEEVERTSFGFSAFGLALSLVTPFTSLYLLQVTALNPLLLQELTTTTALAAATGLYTAVLALLVGTLTTLIVTAGGGTLALLGLQGGFLLYIGTAQEAIRMTEEFIAIVNAIPRRIDVTLGVRLEIPNLTSIGAGIASAMQGADMAAIGAPHRKIGGDVQRGLAYWVGEGGPELFFADEDGTIIPNDQIVLAPPPHWQEVGLVGGDTHNERTITQNFYGPADPPQVKRAVYEATAFYQ